MKVTIQEYEEDPSLQPSSSKDNEEEETATCCVYEYVLEQQRQQGADNATTISTLTPSLHGYRRSRPPGMGMQNKVFVDLFLPLGFPHSVDSSYLPYQLYDGLQGLCSYWRGVVSTQAVLQAAGVGNADATALSAALQWALRDGTGMVGGLVFSYVASHQFDTHVKEFRLFADVINDVALTLDMMAPMVPGQYSLYVLSISTICKTMCGMSAGATKGRITQHFSRHNGNMADLTAKESTQETLVSLLGMIGGVAVAHGLQHAPSILTWLLFGGLTLLHVWANYKAVRLLKLATLNPERTHVLLHKIVQALLVEDAADDNHNRVRQELQSMPSPNDMDESLWSSTRNLLFPTLHARTRPSTVGSKLLDHISEFATEMYVIGWGGGQHFYIFLRVGANSSDELQAYLHALLLQETMATKKGDTSDWSPILIQRTLSQAKRLFEKDQTTTTSAAAASFPSNISKSKSKSINLMQHLEQKGWDLESRLYLGFSSHRIQWTTKKNE